jgi:hypothetical protein
LVLSFVALVYNRLPEPTLRFCFICCIMSASFPYVNIGALKKFAAATAAADHPPCRGNGGKSMKAKPQITGCEDIVWAGEKVSLHTCIPEHTIYQVCK